MNVMVNGIGNIGSTVLAVLNRFKTILNINHIYALKNNVVPWNAVDLLHFSEQGITICTPEGQLGYTALGDVIGDIDYIFDCTANTMGLRNRPWYDSLPNLKGCVTQGSEKGFGIPYMSGINDDAIHGQKFAQVVSCNTHSLAAILSAFCGGADLPNLHQADFVVVRRSEDIGQHQRLVSANVVSRHLSETIGTHHAIDDLFATRHLTPNLTSSDVTTPSQLMHAVRFNIELNKPNQKHPCELIAAHPMLAGTHKFDSNVIFEQGRRYGFQGRLYSHAIVVDNNLLLETQRIQGWAFIPQEGCTILSTIHAYLLQTKHSHTQHVIHQLQQSLLRARW